MMTRDTQRSAKFYLLGSASAFLMAAGAQAAWAAEESAAAANDDLALIEEAQVQTQAQAQQQTDEELGLEEIVITGSRIARSGFEDIFQPAVVINPAEYNKLGFQNIADAINDIPFFGGGNDGETTVSGQNVGQEFVDMFDLGTQRTLTVVNGRRFVPGNPLSASPNGRLEGSQVDLNLFAAPLIERIETLSVGGAPLYGADAVAGTVNIVLKQDFEGVSLKYQFEDGFDVSTRDSHNVEAAFGANTADGRGNVAAAIQFEDQRGVVGNAFDTIREPASSNLNGADPRVFDPREARFNILEGPFGFLPAPTAGQPVPEFTQLGFSPTQANVLTDANGNILTFPGTGRLGFFDPGDPSVGQRAVRSPGGNGFDNSDFNEAIVPVQRFVFQSLGHYDVTDNVTLFFETNFLDSQATDLISQSGTAFSTTFLSAQGQGNFGVSVDNPFITLEDRQTLRAALDRQGFADTNSIFLNGINLGLLPEGGANFVEGNQFRVLGGLKGDLEWGGRNFNYEISMNYGRTRQTRGEAFLRGDAFFNAVDSVALDEDTLAQLTSAENLTTLRETINSETINVIRNGEVANISPTDARVGDIVCHSFVNAPGAVDRDPDNPRGNVGSTNPGNNPTPDGAVQGCTPINPFVGPGGNPEEAIDFVSGFGVGRGKIQQTDFLAFFGGETLELPAGWVNLVFGVERRREFGEFLNGGLLEDGLSREPAIPSIPEEEIVSNELFMEAEIPVLDADNSLGLNDLFGFEFMSDLTVNGSYRFIDQSNTSNSLNVYSAGGTMRFFENQLNVKGNWTRSARQPSIVELFAPAAQTFDQTGDPCDASLINQAQGTNRAQNCLERAQQLGFTDAQLIDVGGGAVGLELVPGDGPFSTPSVNAAIGLGSSGNPDLGFEIGNSWSIGATFTPQAVPGLTVGANFISISVNNVIVEPDFSFFTQDCFDNSNFASGQFRDSCDNFARSGPSQGTATTAGFDIVSGQTQFVNQDTLEVQGIQGNLRYDMDVASAADFFGLSDSSSDLGSVRLVGRFWKPTEFRDSSLGLPLTEDGEVPNVVGGTFVPELEATFDVNYTKGPFDFFWRVTFEKGESPCFKRSPGDCDQFPEIAKPLPNDHEHDMSVGYDVTNQLSLRAGIDDVLGNEPKPIEQAFGGFGNRLKRTYWFQVNFNM